jgi:hypothetical protein
MNYSVFIEHLGKLARVRVIYCVSQCSDTHYYTLKHNDYITTHNIYIVCQRNLVQQVTS